MNPQYYHITDDLLVKSLLGEATEAEEQQLQAWRQASAANEAYYEGFKTILEQSRVLVPATGQDESAAWQRLQQRIQKEKRAVRIPWKRIAAIFILLAGIGFISYRLINKADIRQLVVQAGNQVVSDTLPDRSVVTLNKNSMITYASRFEKEQRTVYLVGEAFFNVQPDGKRPFVVQVAGIRVTVTGTSFNIRSRAGTTEVVVSTGHVAVTKNEKTVRLQPKEKLTIQSSDTTLVKKKEPEMLYQYYHSREFVCDNTPLWKLVQVLNEAYDTRIVIGRKSLRNEPLTVTFENESLDRVLEVISETLHISVTRTHDSIILK